MAKTANVWHVEPGLFNTNSYLSSGIPFVTGAILLTASFATLNSQVRVQFPYVTRAITIVSRRSPDIRLHFNSIADGNVISSHHYVTLSETKDSVTFGVKAKEIYVSLATSSDGDGEFELIAELTNIPAKEMFALTGSGLTD